MALANIGDEDRSTMEPNKKELVKLSEKMITHQINLLGDKEDQEEGLKWINKNFDKIVKHSIHSRELFINHLYRKIIKDEEITDLDK